MKRPIKKCIKLAIDYIYYIEFPIGIAPFHPPHTPMPPPRDNSLDWQRVAHCGGHTKKVGGGSICIYIHICVFIYICIFQYMWMHRYAISYVQYGNLFRRDSPHPILHPMLGPPQLGPRGEGTKWGGLGMKVYCTWNFGYLCIYLHLHIYIYVYTYVYIYTYVYKYVHISIQISSPK